ncbi:MAG: LamB/YcsF family protein [Treponema sp.]|nr:LamB/YcsF family protein [Treponema sp.]
MLSFDINCDMGESFGAWKLGFDEEALALVTSANVACGFHASDPLTMRRTVRLAKRHGVGVGAHPGYPDLVGFGRRDMALDPEEIEAATVYQIGALRAICDAEGVPLRHVKAHGALYNRAAREPAAAAALARAIASVDRGLVMVCLSRSAMAEAARSEGLPYVEEAFADRAYEADGSLVARAKPGSVITDPAEIARRVLRMAREGIVTSIDGKEVALDAATVCVHGDTPGAVAIIAAVRKKLVEEGVRLAVFEGCGKQ